MDGGSHGSRVDRARVHRALGDVQRLAIVDELSLSDRTPSELAELVGLSSNHLTFHLNVLVQAGVVVRTPSAGDARRRYVRLNGDFDVAASPLRIVASSPLFICTRNSARSRLAAAMWESRTGLSARSAGHRPAEEVHPQAIAFARRRGLDLGRGRPCGYGAIQSPPPDLIVSVCDLANESEVPFEAPRVHWSIPDPVADPTQFPDVVEELDRRIHRLAKLAGHSTTPRADLADGIRR